MIGVQSLLTRTPRWQLSRSALLLHTLSLHYARRHFPFVELVTDEGGLVIADRLRWPYSSFRIDLQFIPEKLLHIWSAGKIVAQQIQSEPYAHIDNDLLLYEPLPEKFLAAPIFVQGKDEAAYYLNPNHLEIFDLAGIPRGCVCYNAGVIGGNDLESLHAYCQYVTWLMERVCHLTNGTVLAIITEQAGFGNFCRQAKLTPEELIPFPLSSVKEDFEGCKFNHFWGDSKRNPLWQAKFERRFKADFPEEYGLFNQEYPRIREAFAHPRRSHLALPKGL